MATKNKVTFSDLSFWLKCGIVGGIIYIIFAIIAFGIGFFSALGGGY